MSGNYFVYMHVSPDGKRYIGITQNYIKRWSNGFGYRKNKHFYNAIEKYGWDNFEHIIIAQNLSLHEAEKMEIQLIAKYQSNNRQYGYNHATGGSVNRGYKLSEETKRKLSESHKGLPGNTRGKRLSIEHNAKLQEGKRKHLRLHGWVSPMKGKSHSEETKRKMSESHKGKHSGENNPMFGKNLSEEHRMKISSTLSGRTLSDKHRENLSKSLKGKSPTRTTPVVQLSLNGECIRRFDSIAEAERFTGIKQSAISHAVRGHTKNNATNGFVWRYEKDVI